MLTIKQYQMGLKHYNGYYTGTVDGISGAKTKAAVRSFQGAHGLTVDGVYGTKTNAKLVSVTVTLQKKLGVTADGIIGNKTVAAIKAAQKKYGLVVDGIAGPKTLKALGLTGTSSSSSSTSTKVDWTKVKYFKKSEFKCGCRGKYCSGYPVEMSPKLISILETMRSYYGRPITITSGMRCTKYNNSLAGSVPNSAHRYGKAADFYISGISDTRAGRAAIKRLAYKLGAAYCYSETPNMGRAVHVNV